MITSFPNLLTLSRIGTIPPLIALFYWDSPWSGWVALGLFTVAGATDFFDGYFARSMSQHSRLGRMLDPIADKLLIAAVILMLVAFDKAPTIAALIILCRELLVSGLREFLAELNVGVPVSRLAKWKTVMQMIAIGFLLVGEAGPAFFHPAVTTTLVGEVLLWSAALLTLVTGLDYLVVGLKHMDGPVDEQADSRVDADAGEAKSSPDPAVPR
ncbi:MAG: CDP-diacylglycerol--glycerol-3-phosphate 3-phosphatidyltransferase [Pseudomonadota bacterium]|nr:CDP-diacylglycerol--glycerol-3-phosphate 3-phosphatidyltransferase [Pseudomonadota bacterium]